MEPLYRDLCLASERLEKYWIARVTDLREKGLGFGDDEYDSACGNLSAVVDEFAVWDDWQGA